VALATATALLFGCAGGSTAETRSPDSLPSSGRGQPLDEVLNDIPDDEPGCAAAVYDDDVVAWTGVRGFADREDERRIADDTNFAIGMTGQQFVATAVLLLERNGDIGLDDSVGQYLPTLPAWADDVTVKHLLQRTSGIPDFGILVDETSFHRVTGEDLLRAISAVEDLRFEPGTQFSGQPSDDVLQGFLVEAVADRPLQDFLAEEVFTVAGVEVMLEATPDGRDVATSYVSSLGAPVPEPDRDAVGDVGIYTTASDLAKWGSQYWEPSVGGEDLLHHRTAHMVVGTAGDVSEERPPEKGEEDGRYAAGVFAYAAGAADDPELVIHSAGQDLGYVSDLYIAPVERVAAAVLCNHKGHDAPGLANALLVAYLAER
jgi:CubicO group peptidase (beta-lactamase class C family)